MSKKLRAIEPTAADATKAAFAKMSEDERRKIQRLVKRALAERDLPRFKEGLTRLGLDENGAEYERMMQLWDEHVRSSRHG